MGSSISKRSMLLYCGPGADPECTRDLQRLLEERWPSSKVSLAPDASAYEDEEDLCDEYWLLAFPGGADSGYVSTLGVKGCQNVRKFVHGGGKYIGMCAGAYFACGSIEFAKGNPELEVVGDRLGLFDGMAVGPVFPGFDYKSLAGARAALVRPMLPRSPSANQLPVYFNGGPEFRPKQGADWPGGVIPLAGYDELPGSPACAVMAVYGQGCALLVGVHPEMDKAELSTSDDARLKALYQQLSDSRVERRAWIMRLMLLLCN